VEFSRHNIISQIAGSTEYFIVNLLSGQADIMTKLEHDDFISGNFRDINKLVKKGYLVEKSEEQTRYSEKYLQFIDGRDNDEVQLFFVPGYHCNFGCSYCYQDEYGQPSSIPGEEKLEAFFRFIDFHFADRKKYLTVFGGEPLLMNKNRFSFFEIFIQNANMRNLEIAVVTNGYHLTDYISVLKKAKIREIQVTLDGIADVHNKRRSLKSGDPTFDHIVEGIDSALLAGFPVNLRMVIDKQNIDGLPELARFAIRRGWTSNPMFKTQLGRNYDLHHCHSVSGSLYTRIEMYADIYKLIGLYPEILEFHRPAFSVAQFLSENGELPNPLFDSCPGTKTEWAFDSEGKIYACTATVGKRGEELGSYYPAKELYDSRIAEWESRDVLSISECKSCSLQLACGGGCCSVAKNQSGTFNSPDCRPVKELMELGFAAYFSKSHSISS
jgi:uncharacterized protein